MKQMVSTLAAWRVQEGRQQAFISAWKDLGKVFNALSEPPGKGVLIQSTSDPTLFYSFVPWKSMEAVEAMRNDHHTREGESKGSRDYARKLLQGRFTSSPNRPNRAHRHAASDTITRQCGILTVVLHPTACVVRIRAMFTASGALAAGEWRRDAARKVRRRCLSAQKRRQWTFAC